MDSIFFSRGALPLFFTLRVVSFQPMRPKYLHHNRMHPPTYFVAPDSTNSSRDHTQLPRSTCSFTITNFCASRNTDFQITMNNQDIQMFPSVQEHVNVAPASATACKHMLRCIRLTNPNTCFCGSKAECLLHQQPHPTTCFSATQRLLGLHGQHPHASVRVCPRAITPTLS